MRSGRGARAIRDRIPHNLSEMIREVFRVLGDPVLALWALYILLNPVYVFDNGLPQPGDWLVVPMVPLVCMRAVRFPRDGMRALRPLLVFLGYVTLSAAVWTVLAGEVSFKPKIGFFLPTVIYLYNVIFFVITLVLYERYKERFLWLTVQLTLAAVVMQAGISFVFSRGHIRGAVLFNSSNQLGYFAVVSASILVLGHKRMRMSSVSVVGGLIACAYLALFSCSKAALGSIAILSLVGMVANPRTVLLTGLTILALLSFDSPITRALDRTRTRIENDQSRDFAEERGYDRILKHKEYWLLGAGEGMYGRFLDDQSPIGKHEIHSSAGTLFFCYGLLGCLCFLAFLARVAEHARLNHLLQLLPVAGFSATHQSLRSTLFWVFLALFICFKRAPKQAVADPAPAPAPAPLGLNPVGVSHA